MPNFERELSRLESLASNGPSISEEQAREMIRSISAVFRQALRDAGHAPRDITRITTKFRDAGRRSPPWRSASSRVPGLPQDGSDGNRINRWLLPEDHKFYADEVTATLVEVKYFLQALSMAEAPTFPGSDRLNCFAWLVEHRIEPGAYLDPIQLIPINLQAFLNEGRSVQSGHLVPLDRDGRHVPENAFLMLARSNQLQGNLTVAELLDLMKTIIRKHRDREQRSLGA